MTALIPHSPESPKSHAKTPRIHRASLCYRPADGSGQLWLDGWIVHDADPRGSLEKSRVTVGVLKNVEAAPLFLAKENGHFNAEGLTVEIITLASGPSAIEKLKTGELDFAFSSYVPVFVAQAQKVAKFKIVAANSFAQPESAMIITMPDSGITSARDLGNKKVAVPATGTMADLMVKSGAHDMQVDVKTIEFVPFGFPDMTSALKRGDVDAAFMVEPFIAQAMQQLGVQPIADLTSGALDRIPFTGYAAEESFTKAHPITVEAFQRGFCRGVMDAQDRPNVEWVARERLKIDARTASLFKAPGFSLALDPTPLQRVPDLMGRFDADTEALLKGVDVKSMLLVRQGHNPLDQRCA